jgi:microcin C transport system permease protein
MFEYTIRRLLWMIPTLLGITFITFAIVNLAPGSPLDQKIQQMRFSGNADDAGSSKSTGTISNEVLEAMKKQYGFDKPWYERYFIWVKNLLVLDFGESFTYEEDAIDVIKSKLPVSIQFGVLSFIMIYLISVPLGVFMAIKNGSTFDHTATFILYVAYSIPSFMLGILLIVYFAGGSHWDLFPMGGLYSDFYDEMNGWERFWDRVHHFILPLICYTIGGFTTLTQLMKNSMLDQIQMDYVRTARAKGLDEKLVYFKHALRNALIPMITGLTGLLTIFFAGSVLLEKIFQLDGIGLLSFESVLSRDYNVILAMIVIQAFLMLIGKLFADFLYTVVDPRIDFK